MRRHGETSARWTWRELGESEQHAQPFSFRHDAASMRHWFRMPSRFAMVDAQAGFHEEADRLQHHRPDLVFSVSAIGGAPSALGIICGRILMAPLRFVVVTDRPLLA